MSSVKRYDSNGMECGNGYKDMRFVLASDYEALKLRCGALEASRIAYASEFACGHDGLPDVGSIHANIRALKRERDTLRSEIERMKAEQPDHSEDSIGMVRVPRKLLRRVTRPSESLAMLAVEELRCWLRKEGAE